MSVPPLPARFLNWRLEHRPHPQTGEPVATKVPVGASGLPCNAHDPANHVDYATAAARGNVAYSMHEDDGWFFLDLDKCRGADGNWTPEATAIFMSFSGAWGEVSQSGNGLHILGRCDPSRLKDRKNKWDGWLECYTHERFVAFGGGGWAPIGGTATGQDFTDQLLRVVPERPFLGDLPEGRDDAYTGPEDDDRLIEMMLRSTGGAGAAFGMKASVADLWNADATVLGRIYPAFDGKGDFDHSSADAALMSHLAFWTGKDMPRMDRLFRRSGLMREKYEKREDYRRDTVQGAARLCNKVYDRPREETTGATADGQPHEVYLTIPEMQKHFEGCVYIRDMHRVIVPGGAILKPEQFNASYGGHMFAMMPDGTKPTSKAFEALTENKAYRFPQAIKPCFRPDRPSGEIDENGEINTYYPPNVDMRPGDVTRFLDFLAKLLPDETDRAIMLAYMAGVVQHPGVKFQWAPVLQGTEGNGKTLAFSCVGYAVGRKYVHQPSARQLGGQFNSWLENKCFILVEEIHMQGKREMLDALKPLVTNVEVEVEAKGVDKRMIHNRANWGFCTNYMDAVLKSRNDRRYAVMFTAQQSVDDIARDGMGGGYFPAMYDWLRGGGYAHVAHFLQTYPIPAALDPAGACHRAPTTSSTAAAIAKSMGGIEAEIMEAAEDNTIGFRGGWVSSYMLGKLVGNRITKNRQADILFELGYRLVGRASRPILEEDMRRPQLYALPDVTGGTDEYCAAQFYNG